MHSPDSSGETIPHELQVALSCARQQNKFLSKPELLDHIQTLREYECWQPLRDWLSVLLKDYPKESVLLFEEARAVWEHKGDLDSLIDRLGEMILRLEMSLDDFDAKVRRSLFGDHDWDLQARLLEGVEAYFKSTTEQNRCLERTATIYEKKWFNEEKLFKCYSRLLQRDPTNLKALKYFKVVAQQSQDWRGALDFLNRLLEASKADFDRYKYAQEMAALYLYHLDDPHTTLRLLQSHCQDSPLDDSTIAFDAYQRLGDYPRCLEILENLATAERESELQAILYFKVSEIHRMMGNLKEELGYLDKSWQLSRRMLEALERMIAIKLDQQDWKNVYKLAQELQPCLEQTPNLMRRLSEATERILSVTTRGPTKVPTSQEH